ncbi:hypothetical protein ABZ383_22635 [Streptomyces sp. NPDC005900]|uniref:hypothetical protein n=1 Tax=Streptomyces sp. NPDC005900 TaxID=3154569 RepID=UPI0033D021B5
MTRRHLAAAVACVSAGILVLGCGHADETPDDAAPPRPSPSTTAGRAPEPLPAGRTGTPHGGIRSPDSVDQADPTAVSRAALIVMFSYDTALDTSHNDAARRAADAGWCTPEYAAELRAASAYSGPGAEWTRWAQHRAYGVPKLTAVREAGQPRDTATNAYRQWIVSVTPTGRDKWRGRPHVTTAYAHLTRPATGKPWRLATVTIH